MDFLNFIEREKNKINSKYLSKYFKEFLKSEPEPDIQKVLRAGKEFMLSGGRRLLPISLVQTFNGLASEKFLHQYSEEIYKVSLSIELLHISSLMIEDMVDNESHREGAQTAQNLIKRILSSEFGQGAEKNLDKIPIVSTATTIYEGNIFSILGFQNIMESKFPKKIIRKALRIYQKGLLDISRGRLLNEYYKLTPIKEITLETYLILAGLKRGSQRATASGLGAAFGNARESQWEPLMDGMNKIGIIEQLINDKNGIEEDIRSGQASMLPVIAYQSSNKEQRNAMDKILGKSDCSDEEINEIRSIYEETGAIEFVHHYANSLKNDAYGKLQRVYPGLRKETMDYYEKFLTYIIAYES